MTAAVKPGYSIGRDEHGLTENEREVLKSLLAGKSLTAAGEELGLSRQRAFQLAAELIKKGWLVKGAKRGQYLIETKKIGEVQTW